MVLQKIFTFELHGFPLMFLLLSCLPETSSLVYEVGCQGGHIHQLLNVGQFQKKTESHIVTFGYYQPWRIVVLLMQLIKLLMPLSTV